MILRNPMLWTIILAVIISASGLRRYLDVASPHYVLEIGWLINALTMITNCTVPLALFSNGVWLYGKKFWRGNIRKVGEKRRTQCVACEAPIISAWVSFASIVDQFTVPPSVRSNCHFALKPYNHQGSKGPESHIGNCPCSCPVPLTHGYLPHPTGPGHPVPQDRSPALDTAGLCKGGGAEHVSGHVPRHAVHLPMRLHVLRGGLPVQPRP